MLEKIKTKLINWCLSKETITIGEFHKRLGNNTCEILDYDGKLKFIEHNPTDKYYVKSQSGYSKIRSSLKTIKYQVYKIQLENGLQLKCADHHLIINETGIPIRVIDLKPGDLVMTELGLSKVISVNDMWFIDNMYDLELLDNKHVYYTNRILSHNTQVIAMFLLWWAIFKPDQQILIASKNNNHATEIMDRIRYAYEELPFWLKPGCINYNRHTILFDNKSQMRSESTTEKTGRGLSVSVLYLDELAFVRQNIQEEMWSSLAPTLSTGGFAIISSTPNGDTDLFANLWRGAELGVNGFLPFTCRYDAHPERDETYLAEMTKKLGEQKASQEILCGFLSTEARLMDGLFLQNMTEIVKNAKPLFIRKEVTFWEDVQPDKNYVVGVDPSTGSGKDFTVIEVFSFPEMKQVAEFRSNTMSSASVYSILKGLLLYITSKGGNAWWSVENNGVGEGILSLHEADENPPEDAEFISETGKNRKGFNTSERKKLIACVSMKNFVESGNLTIKSRYLLSELKMFIRKGGSYTAGPGSTDDCIMALLIVVRIMAMIAEYDEEAWQKMYVSNHHDFDDSSEDEEYDETDDYFGIII